MLVPAGVSVNFAAVFDADDLNVAMSVYDDSGTAPVLLLSPFAMAHVHAGTYRGKFTPANGKLYVVFMAVYTDGTFSELDPAYLEQSQSVIAQFLSPPVQRVVGSVQC